MKRQYLAIRVRAACFGLTPQSGSLYMRYGEVNFAFAKYSRVRQALDKAAVYANEVAPQLAPVSREIAFCFIAEKELGLLKSY